MPGAARRDQLEPIETASRDELAAIVLERMQWSVRHAYANVAHYRKKCAENSVHPDDLKTIEDLAKFPFTTKQDLRETYPFGHFAVPVERVARLHASSGTTGQPTVVGYTARDLENWTVVVARSIRAAGGRAGDRCHVA
ncbi:MAG: phenylacetate--CoA ligase family protein, partial [Acetobacteraceae bacterium]